MAQSFRRKMLSIRRQPNRIGIPSYDSIVQAFKFEEGQAAIGSMNNILFDSRDPATFGAELAVNGNFEGTYVSGVAPDWNVDVGVSASEDTSQSGFGSIQQLTNCSGISQGLHANATIALTLGDIYVFTMSFIKNSGTGNIQVQFDGILADTFDIAEADLNSSNIVTYTFYGVAISTTTNVIVTSDNTSLDFSVADIGVKEVGGGNHMVMDFNLYDKSARSNISFDFNGVDQFFSISNARQSNMDFDENFSIGYMVKPGMIASTGIIYAKSRQQGNQRSIITRINNISGAGRFSMNVSGDGISLETATATTGVALPETDFRYIGYSFDTGDVEVNYDDEAKTLSFTSGPPLSVTDPFDSVSAAAIGATFGFGTPPAPGAFFLGEVGQIIIWNGVSLEFSEHLRVFNLLRRTYGV